MRHDGHDGGGTAPVAVMNAEAALDEFKHVVRILDATDHLETPGVPSRAERAPLVAATTRTLKRLAARERAARKKRPRRASPEAPPAVPTEDLPNALGKVVESSTPAPAVPSDIALAFLPGTLKPMLFLFEGVFQVSNPDPVRRQRAIDLARMVLDHPERDRVQTLGALLYRLAMRGTPRTR